MFSEGSKEGPPHSALEAGWLGTPVLGNRSPALTALSCDERVRLLPDRQPETGKVEYSMGLLHPAARADWSDAASAVVRVLDAARR